jgi:hypothetical protein
MTEEMRKKLEKAAELIADNPLPVRKVMKKVGIPFTQNARERLLYRLGANYPVYEDDNGVIGILRK